MDMSEETETALDDSEGQTHTSEPIYVNVNAKKLTNPIQIEDLQKFIEKGKRNDYHIIKKEHGVGILCVVELEFFPDVYKIKQVYYYIVVT